MGKIIRPLVRINPTENIQERIRAVSYFGNFEIESAKLQCQCNRYRPINIYVRNIFVAVLEAKRRYFKECNFIEIIS